MSDAKMIRFIDSKYNDLFFIPDGANIILAFSNGEKVTRPCIYLDSYHTQVGSETFHICQFAEAMERNGITYMPEHPPELPDKCYSTMPASGELVFIEKGKKGYIPCPWCPSEQAEMEAARKNNRLGVTKQQEAAMLGGSLFGWHTHVADVSSYDLKGNPVYRSAQTIPSENKREEKRDDYLRSAEMSTEANYNMVGDGIINNTPPKCEKSFVKESLKANANRPPSKEKKVPARDVISR